MLHLFKRLFLKKTTTYSTSSLSNNVENARLAKELEETIKNAKNAKSAEEKYRLALKASELGKKLCGTWRF